MSNPARRIVRKRRRLRTLRRLLAPGMVIALGVVTTALATFAAHRFVTASEQERFERIVDTTRRALDDRLESDLEAVHAAAGLFAARGELTQASFERFVAYLSPTWRKRTRSVGWAERTDRRPGVGDAFVVGHVHPSGRERIGEDLSRRAPLADAMHRAAQSGDVATSEVVTLDDDGHRRGFYMFFPVYRTGLPLQTPRMRQGALRGFVFTTMGIDAIVTGLEVSPLLRVDVADEPTNVEGRQAPRPSDDSSWFTHTYEVWTELRVGDRQWPVRLVSVPALSKASPWSLVLLTGLVTLVITGLFTIVAWLESRARSEAESTSRRLAESEEALKRAHRAKDEFLGVVSHELRNPLGAMAGALNILKLRVDLSDPAAARAMEIAERQVLQQSRLVDDLLDVTRLSTSNILLDVTPVDLNEILARTLAGLRAAASERRHQLDFEPAPEPVIVDGDAVRLEQIFSNLISNSIKYTPEGGHVRVDVERAKQRVRVRVRDDGAGMPSNVVAEIFAPFYQERIGDTASKGMGLGLTIAQRLVALHGGHISAESEGRGKGSTFTVELPLSDAPQAAASKPTSAPPPAKEVPAEALPTAVVIDDLEDGREVLRVLLESLGVWVHDAGTGGEGLDLISEHRPDLAFVDIDLPDMTGLEIARRVRGTGSPVGRLVAVTGYGAPDDEARAREAGFDEYLVKPVDVGRLSELVADAGRESSAGDR